MSECLVEREGWWLEAEEGGLVLFKYEVDYEETKRRYRRYNWGFDHRLRTA